MYLVLAYTAIHVLHHCDHSSSIISNFYAVSMIDEFSEAYYYGPTDVDQYLLGSHH